MTPQELLHSALDYPPGSADQALRVAAAVAEEAQVEVVLVGGAAVNAYVAVYIPTDIDLVASDAARDAMLRLGFKAAGRHFVLGSGPQQLLVEIPDSNLEGAEAPLRVEVAPGVEARIISVNDLMMDRLEQATDGTNVTMDDALRLATGVHRRIDWDQLGARASVRATVPDPVGQRIVAVLKEVRRTAKRLLRDAAVADGDTGDQVNKTLP